MQWKMLYLARRNPALAAADFAQAWREHSARGRQCRNVQTKILGVAQCSRVLDLDSPAATRNYDGVGVLKLRDLQAASDIWTDPETLAIMRPDEPRVFATYVRDFTLVCAEHVLRDGPQGEFAVFAFVRRRADTTPAAFNAAWTGGAPDHGPRHVMHEATRVVHDLVTQRPPRGYEFDGIGEWWFDSRAALASALADADAIAHLAPGCTDLIDRTAPVVIATRTTHRRP